MRRPARRCSWLVPLAAVVVLVGTWFTGVATTASRRGTVRSRLRARRSPRAWPAAGPAAPAVPALRRRRCWPGPTSRCGCADGPIYLTARRWRAFLAAARVPVRRWLPLVSRRRSCAGRGARRCAAADHGPRPVAACSAVARRAALAVAAAPSGRWCRRPAQAEARAGGPAAATEEQLRMAQDLHDGVGHGLAVIAMQAGVGAARAGPRPGRRRAVARGDPGQSTESLDALRAELATLAGRAGERAPRRPRPGSPTSAALVERGCARPGSPSTRGRLAGPAVPPSRSTRRRTRVVQEALTNVLRHAGATAARSRWTLDAADGSAVDGHRRRAGAPRPCSAGGHGHARDARAGEALAAGRSRRAAARDGGFEVRAELPL